MKKVIKTDKAPRAIGPYSQAVLVEGGKMLFISGVIPLHPETMEIVGKTAGEQCKQVMDNMAQILDKVGADFSHVVKTTIYLTDLNDFSPVNDMYATYFDTNPPARATVEVNRLPKDVKIEIDAIAIL
ncbi:MAG: RidA family protein [FCB group bacterium]|nr:RidA family protein [FCB group bacterium]